MPPDELQGALFVERPQADRHVGAGMFLRLLQLRDEIRQAREGEDGRGGVGEPVREPHGVGGRLSLRRLVVDALPGLQPREDRLFGTEARAEVDLRVRQAGLGGAFLEDGQRVGHALPVRNVAARGRSVLAGIERFTPAQRAAGVVAAETEPVERTHGAQLRHRVHVHAPDLGVLDAGRVVLAPRAARLVAARAAPLRMVQIRLLGEIRRLHAGEVGLEPVLLQHLRARLQRAQVPLGVIGGEIGRELGRHDELEDGGTVHRPVRIRVVPVRVPLPEGMLDLARVDVRGADRLRERGHGAELVDAGRRAADGQRPGKRLHRQSDAAGRHNLFCHFTFPFKGTFCFST